MREYVDLSVMANLVSMLRADIDGVVWLTDSDEDARLFERCIHRKGRILSAPSCAIPLLDLVHSRGLHGVIATTNWSVAPPDLERDNVFYPSLGDTPSLLLNSKAFESVLRDVSGGNWLTASEKEVGAILNRATYVSCALSTLRRLCSIEDANVLDVESVPGIVDWNRFEVDWEQLSATLVNSGVSTTLFERARATCNQDFMQNIKACHGMDVLKVLSAATHRYRPRGISALKPISAEDFAAMLRVAFDLNDFETDEMFWRMRVWARRNPKYPLFRDWRILDPLGMLWDQRYWEGDLKSMLSMLATGESLAAFKMDLDNFKSVNEALGHHGGDEALRLYCKTVRDVLSNWGEVYRRGGDEIVAFAPGIDERLAQRLAEDLRVTIERRFAEWGGRQSLEKFPTSSIGLAIVVQGCTPQQTISLMDDAQRHAKELGKNRVVVERCLGH